MRFFAGLHENIVDVGSFLRVVHQRQFFLVDRVDLWRECFEEKLPRFLEDAVKETRQNDDASDYGTKTNGQFDDIFTAKKNLNFQGTHVVFDVNSWHSMRSVIVIWFRNYTNLFLYFEVCFSI